MKSQDRLAKRAARRAGRRAADSRVTSGMSPGQVRQVRGAGVAPVVAGYSTVDGDPLPDGQIVLTVDAGDVATAAVDAVDALPVTPGESYVAAATVGDSTGWVGLQWISGDGEPGDIVWDGGRAERIVTQGIAPPWAAGCRQLLVANDVTAPVEPEALAVWESLQAHIAGVAG